MSANITSAGERKKASVMEQEGKKTEKSGFLEILMPGNIDIGLKT